MSYSLHSPSVWKQQPVTHEPLFEGVPCKSVGSLGGQGWVASDPFTSVHIPYHQRGWLGWVQQKPSMPFTHMVLHPWETSSPRRQPPFLWFAFFYPRLSHYSSLVKEAKFEEINHLFWRWVNQKGQMKVNWNDCKCEEEGRGGPGDGAATGRVLGEVAGATRELRNGITADAGEHVLSASIATGLSSEWPPTIIVPCNCSLRCLSTNLGASETEALISEFPEPRSVPDIQQVFQAQKNGKVKIWRQSRHIMDQEP